MVRYEYGCPRDGRFDAPAPMGAAPSTAPCPRCAGDAPRVWTPVATRRGSDSARRLLERSERSRDEPSVVTTLPGRSAPARRATANPLHHTLPRP